MAWTSPDFGILLYSPRPCDLDLKSNKILYCIVGHCIKVLSTSSLKIPIRFGASSIKFKERLILDYGQIPMVTHKTVLASATKLGDRTKVGFSDTWDGQNPSGFRASRFGTSIVL